MSNTNYVFHEDPGHGWLAVPRTELRALGIAGEVSEYSYQSRDGSIVYLEEDCDLSLFCRAKGIQRLNSSEVPCQSVYHNNDAPCRSLPRFRVTAGDLL